MHSFYDCQRIKTEQALIWNGWLNWAPVDFSDYLNADCCFPVIRNR